MSDDVDDIAEEQLDPAVEPKSAKAWLSAITKAERAFSDYQLRSDKIDKLYASLKHLADATRDREFQLFWANIQVLGPSIYARPPVPVVVPKFKDRRPLYRVASELLERCSVVTFDMSDINAVMMLLRDDLTILGRGAAWARYETKAEADGNTEKVCLDYLDRRDFLHEPSRNWLEVGWVARRAWMTRKEMRKRFKSTSGDAYQQADFVVRKDDRDNGAASDTLQAGVWEIWSKTLNKVVWIVEGVDVLLDEGKPHLKLEGFFPCPRPAYGTTQRASLIPVPDIVYYKDQLEEINELTGRVHALSDALQVRGFYPAGAGELGDAIEAAMKSTDNRQIMVPISNWAAFGGGAMKDVIFMMPLDMIVTTIAQIVELRRQIIDDVYQIMGLSDIMRGSTEASETLGAQQIKAQYGSIRIRDKQMELVRIARDLVRISGEIMAENFEAKTMLDMSQLEIPSKADILAKIEQITAQAEEKLQQQVQQAMQAPEAQQMAQANPEQAQAMLAQAEQQIMAEIQPEIAKLEQTPTIEQVMKFLRDQRIRPFVLDIETDSTIQPDEDAEKQRRSEFLQALGGTLQQLSGMVAAQPQAAPFAAEILKFAVAPFRAGRSLETAIEEFADMMNQVAKQPQPNPEAMKAEAEAKATEQDVQLRAQEAQQAHEMRLKELEAEGQVKLVEAQDKQAERNFRMEELRMTAMDKAEQRKADLARSGLELQKVERSIVLQDMLANAKLAETAQRAAIAESNAEQQAEQSERSFEQQSEIVAQKSETAGA